MLKRGLVEIPTSVAGLLASDGSCYWLEADGSRRTVVWVEGTRFGRDERGAFVIDISGTKRKVGEPVGLSGGPLSGEHQARQPEFASYVRNCGDPFITGLRFSTD